MLEAIKTLPGQFSYFDQRAETILFSPPASTRSVIIAGMGGSAIPAVILSSYFQSIGGPSIALVRDYHLPSWANAQDLVICSSYSGNTEETLSVYDEALSKKIPLVCVTHGGDLLSKSKADRIDSVLIPECVQPRCGAGYFMAAFLMIFERLGKISSQTQVLKNLSSFLQTRQPQHEALGKKLATFLVDKVPVIYGPTEFEGVCQFWKIKFNENSKVASFWNVYPELNHNEMMGWSHLISSPAIVHLKTSTTNQRIKRRMDVMREMFIDKIPFFELDVEGASFLEQAFDALLVADYASYYLAMSYGFDPAPVALVEIFKKKLG